MSRLREVGDSAYKQRILAQHTAQKPSTKATQKVTSTAKPIINQGVGHPQGNPQSRSYSATPNGPWESFKMLLARFFSWGQSPPITPKKPISLEELLTGYRNAQQHYPNRLREISKNGTVPGWISYKKMDQLIEQITPLSKQGESFKNELTFKNELIQIRDDLFNQEIQLLQEQKQVLGAKKTTSSRKTKQLAKLRLAICKRLKDLYSMQLKETPKGGVRALERKILDITKEMTQIEITLYQLEEADNKKKV